MRPQELYNKTAWIYEERHESPYTKLIRKKEIALIQQYAKGLALDFGCGTGFHSSYYPHLIGADISREMLSRTPNSMNKVLCSEALPFRDASFDTVLCLLSVLNMAPLTETISEFSRILKPGGFVLISVASIFDNKGERTKPFRIAGEKMTIELFKKEQIEEAFRAQGFEGIHFDGLFSREKPIWGSHTPLSKEQIELLEAEPKERGSLYFFVFKKTI